MRHLRLASGNHPHGDIQIADEVGRIVCTLPRDELRLANFIVRIVNLFGFGVRRYDRNDWLRERNTFGVEAKTP